MHFDRFFIAFPLLTCIKNFVQNTNEFHSRRKRVGSMGETAPLLLKKKYTENKELLPGMLKKTKKYVKF